MKESRIFEDIVRWYTAVMFLLSILLVIGSGIVSYVMITTPKENIQSNKENDFNT